MKKFQRYLLESKYEVLLLSLLLLLFGQLLFPPKYEPIITPILLLQNLAIVFILFFENKIWRVYILLTLVMVFGFEIIEYCKHNYFGEIVKSLFYLMYFLSLAIKIFRYIFQQKEIGREMIAAVFGGFIMLSVFGSLLFMLIESAVPNSFSNLGSGEDTYPNLQYFSFITTLTIGYGDIVPLTMSAKKATMLLGLAGNFYTVFIAGIVIGKFIKGK